MHRTVFVSSILLLSMLAAPSALAQSEFKGGSGTSPPGVTRPNARAAAGRERPSTRVAVGERAPDFELTKMDGKPLRLSSLRGDWVMLWFAEDRDSLERVESVASANAEIGVRTVVVCFDKLQALSHYLGNRTLSYVPLADPTGEIVALYGLLDSGTDQVRPGFVLVGPRGNVRLALLGQELPPSDASRLVQVAVQGNY